jgi:hypothetical protein
VLRHLNGDSTVYDLQWRHIVDSTRFYSDRLELNIPSDSISYPVPGPVILVHDTVVVHDTLYLPEWRNGDRMRIGFDYNDDRQVRFGVRWSTDRDTVEQFNMFPTYAPWDSLVHIGRNFEFHLEIEGKEYIDTLIIDGKEKYKLWKVVNAQVIPYNFWGIIGIPSLPYLFVHWEWIN